VVSDSTFLKYCPEIGVHYSKPIARLSRIEGGKSNIRFGILKGKVKVADDFDAPLPDDILSEFEG
jgi:hypothetical protein